jgi:hypothetical protein
LLSDAAAQAGEEEKEVVVGAMIFCSSALSSSARAPGSARTVEFGRAGTREGECDAERRRRAEQAEDMTITG